LLIFASLETKKSRMNICYLKIWDQKIAKSRHEKTKKKSVAANCYKPWSHSGFRRLDTKRVGEHGMQKPLLCFLLSTFAPRERERERARGRQFAFCMMQEWLH
jgi:hypothetical protein